MDWRKQKQKIVDELKKRRVQLEGRLRSQGRNHYLAAFRELFSRYKLAFRFWWDHRDQIKLPDLKAHEAEFLPAALSIQMAPVSPAGRWVARILIGLLLALILWSVIGKMDIIVNGQGKIIVGGYTKTIAAVEVAKVLALHVEEGQKVKAGDLLIELDSRGSDSEQNKAQGDRQLSLLQMERSKALLDSLTTNKEPVLAPIEGVDWSHYQSEARHLQDQWQYYVAKRNRIATQIKRFGNSASLAAQRAKDYKDLSKVGDVSIHAYLEKEQAHVDLQGQLEDSRAQLFALTAETRKAAQDDLYQATRIWSGAVQDVNKALAHSEQLRITSPVDGVVQQLVVHTVGGVVPAAQPLMFIVPSQHTVELEAYVENKDIGFMREGQSVAVKIDAYEYSKYGTIPALVTHVSRDAVDFSGSGTGQFADKDAGAKKDGGATKGLMYAVKVTLKKPTILVDGKEMRLSPGMSGSVEIKTGERRIIEYILSPLLIHAHESFNER
jgi:hemolysin D